MQHSQAVTNPSIADSPHKTADLPKWQNAAQTSSFDFAFNEHHESSSQQRFSHALLEPKMLLDDELPKTEIYNLALANQSLEQASTSTNGSSVGAEARCEDPAKFTTLDESSALKITIPKPAEEQQSRSENGLLWAKYFSQPGLVSFMKADPGYRRLKVSGVC